jgi:hypothetical protein
MSRRRGQRSSRPRPRPRSGTPPRPTPGLARRNRRLAFVLLAAFALIALAILASPFATVPTRP